AGPGPARPQAGFPDATRARPELCRRIHRLYRRHQSVRRRRPSGAWRLRLAVIRDERLEGGADAPRVAASQDPVVEAAHRHATPPLPRVSRGPRVQAVEVLQRPRAMDRAAGCISKTRLT